MSLLHKTSGKSQYIDSYSQEEACFELEDHKSNRIKSRNVPCSLKSKEPYLLDSNVDNIFQEMPDPIIIASLAGVIRSINFCAERLFDYTRNDLAGQSITVLFTNAIGSGPLNGSNHAFEVGRWHSLTSGPAPVVRRKKGEIVTAEIYRCDCVIDGLPCCIYKISEATQTIRMQEIIAQSEHEIALLSRIGILGELTAAITHELSQPLTAIASYIAAAHNCYSNTDDVLQENGLELISKAGIQAQHAWQIIQRLRMLLQNRDISQRDTDLRTTIKDAIELATLGVAIDGLELRKQLPDTAVIVKIDPVQIQILLANLIRNAIDELRVSEGRKIISIGLKVKQGKEAEITVSDTGPGIAEHVIDSIFNPFLTTKPEGLGVGLAVSRRIAQAHKGRLAARNLDEGGAEFSFILPVSVKKRVENE